MTNDPAVAAAGLPKDGLSDALAGSCAGMLYGLCAAVRLHFAKEEGVYLAIHDAELTPDAASEMRSAPHHAEHHG